MSVPQTHMCCVRSGVTSPQEADLESGRADSSPSLSPRLAISLFGDSLDIPTARPCICAAPANEHALAVLVRGIRYTANLLGSFPSWTICSLILQAS